MQIIKCEEEAPGPTAVKQKLQFDTSGWIMLFKAPSQTEQIWDQNPGSFKYHKWRNYTALYRGRTEAHLHFNSFSLTTKPFWMYRTAFLFNTFGLSLQTTDTFKLR